MVRFHRQYVKEMFMKLGKLAVVLSLALNQIVIAQGLDPGSIPPSPDDYPSAPDGKIRYITLADLPVTWQEFFRRTEVGKNEMRKRYALLDSPIQPAGSINVEFIDGYKPYLIRGFNSADRVSPIAQIQFPELAKLTFAGFLARARLPDQAVITVGRVWYGDGMKVLFEEWDYARARVGVTVRSDLALYNVNSTPAQLTAHASEAGQMVLSINWTTAQRRFGIDIESKTANYEKVKQFALEMARSVILPN
jgi:hypothetical protein